MAELFVYGDGQRVNGGAHPQNQVAFDDVAPLDRVFQKDRVALDVVADVVLDAHAIGAVHHHAAVARIPHAAVAHEVASGVAQRCAVWRVRQHVPVDGVPPHFAGLTDTAQFHAVQLQRRAAVHHHHLRTKAAVAPQRVVSRLDDDVAR